MLLLALRLRQRSGLWQALSIGLSFSPAELIKTFCHLPTFQPFGLSNQAELLTPGCSSCMPSSLWGRESSPEQEQALGICISPLLTLRYEKGRGLSAALDSKHSRFSHAGTAPIHLWLWWCCSSAPSLLSPSR